MELIIYGSYGYTGGLLVEEAVRRGIQPILAGRNGEKLEAQSAETGLPFRVAGLSEPEKLASILEGVSVVLHAAGPFSETWKPMADACIATGTHYLDVTGEWIVFEGLAARSEEAASAGVMLLPGVGFDVVPSDCLAGHLKNRLPDGEHLELALWLKGTPSRGTARTMARHAGHGSAERRDGRIVPERLAKHRRSVDFGDGPTPVISIPWGDISTAYHSTGIPNVTCYAAYPAPMRWAARMSPAVSPLIQTRWMQERLLGAIDRRPAGPSSEQRARGRSLVWGEIRNRRGETAQARMAGPDGYTLTAMTGIDIALRVIGGEYKPGFQTPSSLLGAAYASSLEGVSLQDLG